VKFEQFLPNEANPGVEERNMWWLTRSSETSTTCGGGR